ncbi:hypothetical protein [Lentzea albidocapillata]|uniref:Uncharacterized protein n=1 Tax=Lentzea albidocapillata TaxID=40571 RepID=A0A1W2FCP9_9PSEU|nr:hypothetical protein [Lentzea albidocapillata]SMD19717.1 hypothetical protein SAMN05660733_05609 [Lentzea albidocapillata]
MRVALLLVRFAAAVVGDERCREQWEADVVGARELGMSPFGVAVGAVRAAVVIPSKGAAVAGIGPLGIALKHAGTSRGRVLAIAVVSALMVLGGLALLFA